MLACCFALTACTTVTAAEVSQAEAARWLRWVIPLPKEIGITGKVELSASEVEVALRDGAGDVEKTAADGLVALFKEKAGADPAKGRFEILIGACDEGGKVGDVTVAGVARLKKLPNSEQAYVIRPTGDNRLVLAALDERGVYYAALTLRQLLEGRFAGGKVTIPLVTVTDWPDLAWRGQWGNRASYPLDEIEWMAHLKLNRIEYVASVGITADGKGLARTDADKLAFARCRALRIVPHITHLNCLDRDTGGRLFKMFPELEGKENKDYDGPLFVGEVRGGSPCASQPKFVELLAEMMTSLAEQGAAEVSGWLTEGTNHQCLCDRCLSEGKRSQYWLEARAYVAAWRLARKRYPGLELRLLTSQGSHATNDRVIAELPPEVGLTYYSSGRTYNSRPLPMVYPLLENFTRRGGRLGVTPQLTPTFAKVVPWTGPQFVRYRMREFADKKLDCLAAYVVPANQPYRFNVTASAEWSWNAHGRDPRQFALAWATRNRIADPEAYADWALKVGEVGWRVFGSDIPYRMGDGRISNLVKHWATPAWSTPTLGKDQFGGGTFAQYPSVEQMDRDLAICDQAMAIARRLDRADMIHETRVIEGYVEMLKQIYTIAEQTSRAAEMPPTRNDRIVLQVAMSSLAKASWQCTDGLEKWWPLTGMRYTPGRFTRTVADTKKTVLAIGEALSVFGVTNPTTAYMKTNVWQWTGADFKDSPRRTVKLEVTDKVPYEGGTVELVFHIPGAQRGGFRIHRVALASTPVAGAEQLTPISADDHLGTIGHRRLYPVYRLNAPQRDPNLRYFILPDMEAVELSSVGKRKGTVSMVTVVPQDFDPDVWDRGEAGRLRPLTDRAHEQLFMPKFTSDGVRVGVVQGAHGSPSILAHLRTVDGLDAQPLQQPNKEAIERCQVVVVSKMYAVTLPEEFQRDIRQFVQNGGGLIALHQATGHGHMPPLIPEICVKGARRVRYTQWAVTTEHPVTKGIAANRPLSAAFPDTVELEPGPDGQVLAATHGTGKPIMVVGTFGKGRYVACGLLIATAVEWEDVPAEGAERVLLENAVRWCGAGR